MKISYILHPIETEFSLKNFLSKGSIESKGLEPHTINSVQVESEKYVSL